MPDGGTDIAPLVSSLQALPIGVHVVLGIGLAAGVVLWLAGQKVVRPIFAVIGLVLGAALGFFLAPLLAIEPVHDIPTPYLGMGAGALVGLGTSVALFRFAMAIGAAAVVAIAGMLGTATYLANTQPAPDGPARVTEVSSERVAAPEWLPPDDADEMTRWAIESAARTREFLSRATEAGQERWARVPGEHRLMVAGAGLGGAVCGFLFGVFVPRRASALVTALCGSAMWLACAAWIAHATGAPGLAFLEQPAKVWIVIWPATSAIGTIIQWVGIFRNRKSGD
jgi:hypothetical protein